MLFQLGVNFISEANIRYILDTYPGIEVIHYMPVTCGANLLHIAAPRNAFAIYAVCVGGEQQIFVRHTDDIFTNTGLLNDVICMSDAEMLLYVEYYDAVVWEYADNAERMKLSGVLRVENKLRQCGY